MVSNGSDRGGLLSAGGVLSIVAGVFELIAGGIMVSFISVSYTHLTLPTILLV